MHPCAWCKATEAEPLLQRRDRLGNQVFRYLRCCRCGLIRLDPFPSLIHKAQYYPPTYEAYQNPSQGWPFSLGQRHYWSRRVQAVRRFLPAPAGTVLDVGCATGGFLVAMQRRGWQVAGIESNEGAAAHARRQLGAGTVQAAPVEEIDYPPGSFDLIALWDVLDHLQDPVAVLQKIYTWLRPGGLVTLGVPDPSSWDAGLFGPYWLGWDAPRHLYVFPENVLRAILQGTGFQVLAACCFYGGHGSFVTSLGFWLQGRVGDQALRRLIGLRAWRYLLWPYYRLGEWMGRGPIRTYFCRPSSRSGLDGAGYNYAFFPVLFPCEAKLLDARATMWAEQIFPRRYFYPSLSTLDYTHSAPMPVSEGIARRVLCLPLWHAVDQESIQLITGILRRTVLRSGDALAGPA